MLIRCTRNYDILMIQLLQSVVVFVAVVGIAVVVVWGSGSGIGGGEPRELEATKPFDCSIVPTICGVFQQKNIKKSYWHKALKGRKENRLKMSSYISTHMVRSAAVV